jgi:hypothetical protein
LKIKLATGKELDCDQMSHSERHKQTTVRILNTSLSEAARIFSNPAETVQMHFENEYAAGFTKLLAVIDDENAIRVVLGKE